MVNDDIYATKTFKLPAWILKMIQTDKTAVKTLYLRMTKYSVVVCLMNLLHTSMLRILLIILIFLYE